MVLLWLFYFYSYHFYCVFFKKITCQKINFKNYEYIGDYCTSELFIGNIFVFLKNFFYYQAKFLAFNYYYNFLKVYYQKNENKTNFLFLVFLFSLAIILPVRLFIKWLTGFSYFTIRTSAICSNLFLDVYNSDWDKNNFYSSFFEIWLQLITSYFFLGLFSEVKIKKIYYNTNKMGIYFNPNKYPFDNIGKVMQNYKYSDQLSNIDYLKASFIASSKIYTPQQITITNVHGLNKTFNGTAIKNKDGSTFVYVESSQKQPIVFDNNVSHKILRQIPDGLYNTTHVNSYVFATVYDLNMLVFYKILKYTEKNIPLLEKDKFLLHQAFLLSMFEKDTVITSDCLKESFFFENTWDRLSEMYNKKELHPSFVSSYGYCHAFLVQNFFNPIILGPRTKGEVFKEELRLKESPRDHKIKLYIHLIKNIRCENGNVWIPENLKDVPYDLHDSIKNLWDL